MTAPAPLTCPQCQANLPGALGAPGSPQPCPVCARPLEGLVFSAYNRPLATGKTAEALIAAEDAGCFYHSQSRAQSPCDICGRFLCALCDVEMQGQHFCPGCVNAGRRKKQIQNLDGDRMLYGGMASILALLPLIIFWPLTVITGPLAVFVAIYGWKKPQSLTGAGRGSSVIAILFGLLETAAWAFFIAKIFKLF